MASGLTKLGSVFLDTPDQTTYVAPNQQNNLTENEQKLNDGFPTPLLEDQLGDIKGGAFDFGTKNRYSGINPEVEHGGISFKYSPIENQEPNPPSSFNLKKSEESPSLFSYSGYENEQGVTIGNNFYEGLSTENPKIRNQFVNGAGIGIDRDLGVSENLKLESIYDPTHGSNYADIQKASGVGSTKYLDIRASNPPNFDQRGPDRGIEPLIVKPIGSKDYSLGVNRDGFPINAFQDDLLRVTQFYQQSEAGQQISRNENLTNILIGEGRINSGNAALIIPDTIEALAGAAMQNPTPGINTGFLNFFHSFRDLPGPFGSLRKPLRIEYSKRVNLSLPFKNLGDKPFAPVDKAVEKALNTEIPDGVPNIIKKPIEDLKVRVLKDLQEAAAVPQTKKTPFIDLSQNKKTTYNDKISRRPVGSGKVDDLFDDGDFYVRIKDLRGDGRFIYFRGFATGITENVTPTFSPTQYIGRSEDVYIYQKAERDLTFNLRVTPANRIEQKTMYNKLEHLTSLAYPKYLESSNRSDLTRMQPPFTELYMAHIGSKAKGQFGFIKSLTYTVSEQGDWDALAKLPRVFDIAIGYQILNKKPPSLATVGETGFYRLR